MHGRLAAMIAASLLVACGGGGNSEGSDGGSDGDSGGGSTPPPSTGTAYRYELPSGFPEPVTVLDDPSVEQVALGRQLFYEPKMSREGDGSCVSCHQQRLAFSDGQSTAVAPGGEVHPRNAMSLTNVVYNARQNWSNPNIDTLRQQAQVVLFNEQPVELGWSGHEQAMLDRLAGDPALLALFEAAYPGESDPVSVDNVLTALSAFTSTLISGDSAYDRYHDPDAPDPGAMSASALRGEALFFGEKFECHHCHNGFNFANSVTWNGALIDTIEYRNNALYNILNDGSYPYPSGNYPNDNQGLYEFTQDEGDMGRFRPPTLRNIALTAPYMHDGSIATLREVIVDHYAAGGRTLVEGPYAGVGANSPYKDALMIGFNPTESEIEDLLAFLDSLTDWNFVCDTAFSDPTGASPMHTICAGL